MSEEQVGRGWCYVRSFLLGWMPVILLFRPPPRDCRCGHERAAGGPKLCGLPTVVRAPFQLACLAASFQAYLRLVSSAKVPPAPARCRRPRQRTAMSTSTPAASAPCATQSGAPTKLCLPGSPASCAAAAVVLLCGTMDSATFGLSRHLSKSSWAAFSPHSGNAGRTFMKLLVAADTDVVVGCHMVRLGREYGNVPVMPHQLPCSTVTHCQCSSAAGKLACCAQQFLWFLAFA